MLKRHAFIAGALALLIAVPVAYAQIAIPDNIAKAVANPARVQKQKDRDAGRKPAEVFALAGLKTGDKVIELGSFGHYDSEIIAAAIGPTGKLYMYDLPYMANREAAFKAFVDGRANAEHKTADFDKIDYPQGIDMVVIDMYYHDIAINNVDTPAVNTRLLAALKPGGRVLIVDHNAEAGSGRRDSKTIHRIDPAVIKDEMTKAGFRLVTDSKMFANTTDDHTKMVFEATTRGSTDRSLLVYEKPR